jgi:hypothetical protein
MQPLQPMPAIEELPEPLASDWRRKLGVVLFVMVCFEVGLFLLIFPWMQFWRNNSIAGLAPWMHELWISPYFRGALSGLGVLNLYISIAEVVRFRRPPAGRLGVSVL